MLEFIKGPHGSVISENEKLYIIQMLNTCTNQYSFSHQVNFAYNNKYHFINEDFGYDTFHFLNEIKRIIVSPFHKIQVMGSIHEDPFGHSSYLIGQYDEERFFPSVVKDKYIRFKVVFDKKYNSSRFNILNEYFIFHFLVDVPEVVKLQLHHYNQIIMQPLLNSDGSMLEYPALYPKSYTYIQVQGLEY